MVNTHKLFYKLQHSHLAQKKQKELTDKAKQTFLSLLKESLLLKIAAVIAAVTAILSGARTLWCRTYHKLNSPQSLTERKNKWDIEEAAHFRIISSTAPQVLPDRIKLSVICGILIYDLSQADFSSNPTICCDTQMGIVILVLPDNIKAETQFHNFLGQHLCDAARPLDDIIPTLKLRANIYMSLFHVKWSHRKTS
ncbi:MAG: hypothetical protein ACI4C1_10680 [Lachnospiraceae bacterium]